MPDQTSSEPIPSVNQPGDGQVQPESTPQTPSVKKSRGVVVALIIILVSLLASTGWFGYQYWQMKQQAQETQPVAEQPQTTHPEEADPTANWQTYTNEEYGFEFKYPQDYSLKEVNADYILIKKNDDPKNSWLISIDVEKDIEGGVNDTANLSFHDFAVNRAKAFCAADGPGGSYYCDKATEEESYKNPHGINGYIFYLNLITETFGENSSKTNTVKGPVYALDISDKTNARLIIVEFADESTVKTFADEQNLQNILSTFRFLNESPSQQQTDNQIPDSWKTYNQAFAGNNFYFRYPETHKAWDKDETSGEIYIIKKGAPNWPADIVIDEMLKLWSQFKPYGSGSRRLWFKDNLSSLYESMTSPV